MRNIKSGSSLAFMTGLLAAWLSSAPTARAANHLWEFSELYSNADGSVQFIEMHNDFDLEGFVAGLTITSTNTAGTMSNTFTFPGNTADPNETSDRSILIATPGFGSLPGGVAPDFTIPAGFLFQGGGSVNYPASGDFVTFASLPADGTTSLTRDMSTHAFAPATNSPENFAGATGSVPEPAAGAMLLFAGAAIRGACRRSRRPDA